MKYFINAGHLAPDNTKESKLTIAIRNALHDLMPNAYYVHDNLDLRKSIDWINDKLKESSAESFAVGIHINANNDTQRRGTEAYYSDDPKYAKVFSRCVAKSLGVPNAGAIHDSKSYVGSLGFLRQLKCPSVIIEVCYSTNLGDRIALENDGIKKAAQGIKNALDELFPPEVLKKKISLLKQIVVLLKKLLNLLKYNGFFKNAK